MGFAPWRGLAKSFTIEDSLVGALAMPLPIGPIVVASLAGSGGDLAKLDLVALERQATILTAGGSSTTSYLAGEPLSFAFDAGVMGG